MFQLRKGKWLVLRSIGIEDCFLDYMWVYKKTLRIVIHILASELRGQLTLPLRVLWIPL